MTAPTEPAPVAAAIPAWPIRGPVWLVRHAPTSWTGVRWCGRADPPLGEEGRLVAAALARKLAGELPPLVAVWTSPLRRAVQTADAIAAAALERGLSPLRSQDDDLVEVDVGRVEGLTWGEVLAREPGVAEAILAGGRVDWPGGETAADVDARAAAVAARLAAATVDRSIVVVSHGGFIHALARALAGAELAAGPEPLRAGGVIRLVPAEVGAP